MRRPGDNEEYETCGRKREKKRKDAEEACGRRNARKERVRKEIMRVKKIREKKYPAKT